MPTAPQKSIFNKRASDKLKSPEDLDKYLRVTNPSVWMILVACIALFLGALAWGFRGTVSTSVSAQAVWDGKKAICLVAPEKADKMRVGDSATVEDRLMNTVSISELPISHDEGRTLLGSDYLVSRLFEDDWAYVVTLEPVGTCQLKAGVPLRAEIVIESVRPIDLIVEGAK